MSYLGHDRSIRAALIMRQQLRHMTTDIRFEFNQAFQVQFQVKQ